MGRWWSTTGFSEDYRVTRGRSSGGFTHIRGFVGRSSAGHTFVQQMATRHRYASRSSFSLTCQKHYYVYFVCTENVYFVSKYSWKVKSVQPTSELATQILQASKGTEVLGILTRNGELGDVFSSFFMLFTAACRLHHTHNTTDVQHDLITAFSTPVYTDIHTLTRLCCCSYSCCKQLEATYWRDIGEKWRTRFSHHIKALCL